MRAITDGFRRAFRAWPIALLVTALIVPFAPFFPPPAPGTDDRLAALAVSTGGFPFHISDIDHYYWEHTSAQKGLLIFIAVLGTFLAGGIIDRLARDTRGASSRFFAACGACVLPLLRLTALAALVYWLVLLGIQAAIGATMASDPAVPTAIAGAAALVLFFTSLVFDYARVRIVIEDRRSAVGAIGAAFRMLRAHAGVILLTQGAFWIVMLAAKIAAPAGTAAAFVDIALRLALIAAQVSIYQRFLASAGWIARQPARWPDEPSANPAQVIVEG